jgi:hypothetical protein
MMIISHLEIQQDTIKAKQDTVKVKNIVLRDSVGLNPDSSSISIKSDTLPVVEILHSNDSVIQKPAFAPRKVVITNIDTTSVCSRNSVADITFYNPDNIITKMGSYPISKFPFLLTENNMHSSTETRALLIKHLKPGLELPYKPFHGDWIIGIIMFATFLFSIISTTSKGLLSGIPRFFMFRGINDPISRDTEGIFNWQSTILNLASFLIIALFASFAATFYNLIPPGFHDILFWLISLGIIIIAITLRHFTCIITGNLSGEKMVFREYLINVYHSYRFSALFLFIIVILTSYTVLLPYRISFTSGIIVLIVMYLIRIIKLTIIFLNRNISIFYLILYLCALEILPVLISVKYFTGLI